MSTFTIDFFELSFLAEAYIPPVPIARSMFWDELCDKHYHKMTPDERKHLFGWIQESPKFDLYNEDCQYFYARFNPANQYRVRCFYDGEAQEVDCFRFNDRYHTRKNTSINEEYVTNIERAIVPEINS